MLEGRIPSAGVRIRFDKVAYETQYLLARSHYTEITLLYSYYRQIHLEI